VRVELAAAGPVSFRVPRWSATLEIDGVARDPKGGWVEVEGRAGTNVWSLRFDMVPRQVNWTGRSDDDIRDYVRTFMEYRSKNPEMAGLVREEAGVRFLRGPLVLAKGRLAGTSRDETLGASTVRGYGWKASLRPAPHTAKNAGVPQTWFLTLSRGPESKTIPVADFASVSNVDDPSNWFSLWF
jgi:hypothetical protein